MSIKIVLGNLEKTIFPDIYPYFNDSFKEDLEYVREANEYDKTSNLNIRFKCKLANYSIKVQDNYLRQALYSLYKKYIETVVRLDYEREYNWDELKSILWFFITFSSIQNEKEIYKLIRDPHTKKLHLKYSPQKPNSNPKQSNLFTNTTS